MTAFELCNSLNWQLFAEDAGSESGVTEANAQPQAEVPSNGPEDFEKLIKGPYKQAYDARVKSILQQRLKSSRETAEKYAAAQPVLELMRQRLGIEGEDYGAMEQALRERLPETNPAGQQQQEAEIQAGADRMVEAWQQRSREIQETYPEFDLEREMLRADFRQLLRARVDMQTAYEILHKEEIIPAAMAYAAQTTERKLAEKLRGTKVDFDAARESARSYSPEAWERAIHRAYGPAAEGVIALEEASRKNESAGRLARIDAIQSHWEEITALLAELPGSAEVMELLRSLQSPCLPEEIGVDGRLLRDTLLYAKEVRPRYTLLQMAWDLGVLERLSDDLISNLQH